MRYLLHIAYDGTRYHGWQTQPNAHTVQEELNRALGTLLGHETETLGCGRTDTGVHARQFYLHFDNPVPVPDNLVYKLNQLLPADIAVFECTPVRDDFHARFDAVQRAYEYHICRRKDPFMQNRAWQYMAPLNLEAMQRGAELIKDYTDFQAFSKSRTQVFTYNCKIEKSYWEERGHLLIYHISADRFLRNMVRAIVGTLVEMGKEKLDKKGLAAVIEGKSRSDAGASVPACGLYLVKVSYPDLPGTLQ